MTNTLAVSYITRLPQHTSKFRELQLSLEMTKKIYADASFSTSTAWKMFDLAVEDGNTEAKNQLAELAVLCEHIQQEAYKELEDSKRNLLELFN